MEETIKSGDYVIIQREDYMKVQKVKNKCTFNINKNNVDGGGIVGHRYFDHFEMKLKSKGKYTLEKVENVMDYSTINIARSGADNRDIQDDGNSQQLSKEAIEKLRDDNANSTEIIEKLVANSTTFDKKTEFSQEKYLKKKQKKYFGYITVRKPTIRILANIFYKDTSKHLPLRIDDLSQILTYANIQAEGKYVLYDTGTNGLLPAAIMNLVGRDNDGQLVYMHPGNECQKNALQIMQFPEEQSRRCINVNIYSVLRWHYQKKSTKDPYVLTEGQRKTFEAKGNAGNGKEKFNEIKREVKEEVVEEGEAILERAGKRKFEEEGAGADSGEVQEKRAKRPNWHYANEAALKIFHGGVDSLIIAAREHPVSIANEFVPFLKPSGNFVVFSTIREPLQDLYFAMVNRSDLTNVRLSTNFMRNYQVLPERTHPLVNMNSGGYLLTAVKLKF